MLSNRPCQSPRSVCTSNVSTQEKNLKNMQSLGKGLLALILLVKQFASGTPVETCSAEDRKYWHNGICCNMCRPGEKLERHCEQDADDGVCAPCPRHYYTAVWNYASNCRAVNPCNKSHEYIRTKAALDGSSDNECACELGYQYSGSGDICLKIREGVVVTPTLPNQGRELSTDHSTQTLKNDSGFNVSPSPSENRTEPQIAPGITNNDEATKFHYIIGFLAGSFIIMIIVFLVCYKRKMCCFRNRSSESDENLSRNVSRDGEGYLMPKLSAIKHDDTLEEEDEGTGTGATPSRRTSDDVQQNNQNDSTASLSSGYCDEVSMTDEDIKILRKYKTNFAKDLPTEKVLERMPEIFDEEDVAAITNPSLDKCQQRRKLIEVLMTKGPNAFDEFVKVLEEVCKHLANGLKKEKRKK